MTKTIVLSKDHKFEVEIIDDTTVRATFFEHYTTCGWRKLDSEMWDRESFNEEYEVNV